MSWFVRRVGRSQAAELELHLKTFAKFGPQTVEERAISEKTLKLAVKQEKRRSAAVARLSLQRPAAAPMTAQQRRSMNKRRSAGLPPSGARASRLSRKGTALFQESLGATHSSPAPRVDPRVMRGMAHTKARRRRHG